MFAACLLTFHGQGEAEVQASTDSARSKGISGVPNYEFNDGQYTLSGGQPVEVFAKTLMALSRGPTL